MREFVAILACVLVAFVLLKFVLPMPEWTVRLRKKISMRLERRRRRVRVRRAAEAWRQRIAS